MQALGLFFLTQMQKYFWFSLGLFLLSSDAHAYLDPGSGSLLFQAVLALLFSVGMGWRRIKQLIRGLFKKSPKKFDDSNQ